MARLSQIKGELNEAQNVCDANQLYAWDRFNAYEQTKVSVVNLFVNYHPTTYFKV